MRRRLPILFFIGLTLSCLLLSTLSQRIFADTIYQGVPGASIDYIDYGHVKVDFNLSGSGLDSQKGIYKLVSINGATSLEEYTLVYALNGSGGGECAPRLTVTGINPSGVPGLNNGSSPASVAKLEVKKQNAGSSCTTLSQNDVQANWTNALQFFNWQDKNTIVPVSQLPYRHHNTLTDDVQLKSYGTFIKGKAAPLDPNNFYDSLASANCYDKITNIRDENKSADVSLWDESGSCNNGDSFQTTGIAIGSPQNATADAGKGAAITDGSNNSGADVNAAPSVDCGAGSSGLDFLLCPMVQGIVNLISPIDTIITKTLTTGTDETSTNGNPTLIFGASSANENSVSSSNTTASAYYEAWKSFRNIALSILVLVGLVVIISQALGFEILDAYTIRKVLPRLLFAVILIILSWALMRFAVQFTNALGSGIRSIIGQPFLRINDGKLHGALGGGGQIAVGLAASAGFATLGIIGLLSFVATAGLAVLTAFIVLVLRQIVIVALIVVAPLAILLFVLPNTNKFFKIWFESFSKALLMFPLIAALIATGRAFSAVASQNESFFSQFIAYAAYFAPYFLIPFALKFAGGAMGAIGGVINNKSKGGFAALSKYRGGLSKKNYAAMQNGTRYNPNASNKYVRGINKGLNSLSSSVVDPLSAAKLYGGSALRKAGVDTSIGIGLGGRLDAAKYGATTKMAEQMSSGPMNDRALRMVMGMENVNAKSLRGASKVLQESADPNDRAGGDALALMATQFATDGYKNPETGKANLSAAAGLALANQGFADADDIAQLGNRLGGRKSGYAQTVVTQAQVLAQKSRADFKPGYSVRAGLNGEWEGTTSSRSRVDTSRFGFDGNERQIVGDERARVQAASIQRIMGVGAQDLAGKPAAIDALSDGYVDMFAKGTGDFQYTDETGNKTPYAISSIDQERALTLLGSMNSQYNGGSADHARKADAVVERIKAAGNLTPEMENIYRRAQGRESLNPGEAAAASAANATRRAGGGSTPPPFQPPTIGGGGSIGGGPRIGN